MNHVFPPFILYHPRRVLAALACLLIFLTAPAFGQEARPRSAHSTVQALDAAATQVMRSIDNAALQAQHPLPIGGGPLRFAEPLTTSISPAESGTWEQLNDGTWLWRIRIRSADAVSLSLGFTRYHMPENGQLFLYAPDYSVVRGPFTAKDNEKHGELWTPLIPEDEIIVEVSLPADQRDALALEIGQVSHGFRALRAPRASKASGSCNIDVACDAANPWRNQARAVGRYTLSTGVLCSGVLVNNTADDRTPYFLTANHCGVTPENAASLVVYWNFENTVCRSADAGSGPGDGSLDQFTSGAIHRAAYSGINADIEGGPDFTLVEMDEPIDGAYDVYFAGWNREDASTSRSVGIHHPQGEEKRISFDNDASTITSYLSDTVSESGATHLRVAAWDQGTTEGGSSGSPLFNANQRVVGVLSGGFAGCSTSDPSVDNDAPDWYGRIAIAWEGGGTPETRLRDWLDPAATGTLTHPGIDQEIDTISPSVITDLNVASVDSEGITLQWTAPGDDGFQGTAAQYELRYATAPIRSRAAFDAARVASNVPSPQPSGSEERFTVQGLRDNTPYYFALLARDNVNNASPLAATSKNTVILEEPVVVRPGYPNPFRTTTTVGVAVDEMQRIQVDVYDALGRRIQRVYDDAIPANTLREFQLGGSGMASGVYFVRIVGDVFERTTQVVRAR